MHITIFRLAQIPASHQMILNTTIVLTFQVGVWPYSQRDNQVYSFFAHEGSALDKAKVKMWIPPWDKSMYLPLSHCLSLFLENWYLRVEALLFLF